MADVVGFRNFRFTPSYGSSSSLGSSGRLPFRADRYRLTLEDEKEARHLALSELALHSSRPRRTRVGDSKVGQHLTENLRLSQVNKVVKKTSQSRPCGRPFPVRDDG